ncbi:NAD-P-binding protein [Roridomyces roridus]|uniref:NAD-P-binding protein n=1 Tax=Roridomyces roridus TaxID=1738132 RepID=A0AAD7FPY1_9AGAR|nr:NAD-P-binding protein [Roridomyces roridus]
MSRGVVLVTGVNGFIGTYVALAFLDAGYTVRGTARTETKAAGWITHFPVHKAAYEYAVIPDLVAPGAFEAAIKGCDIVAHVASPINSQPNQDNERDVLIPAINGMRNLLAATKTEPRIRHVVFCSTLATVLEPREFEPGRIYTAKEWNCTTYEEAKKTTNPRITYGASKALAERAFWEFIAKEQPAWVGTAILPSAVFGAPIQPLDALADLNRSVAFMWDVANGKFKSTGLEIPPSAALYISVHDVALAHLRAVERGKVAAGKRYILSSGTYDAATVVDILYRNFPQFRANLPVIEAPAVPQAVPLFNTAETLADLEIDYVPFERLMVEMIEGVVALKEKLHA